MGRLQGHVSAEREGYFDVFRGELNFKTKAYREARRECSSYSIEMAANVPISLREMNLVRCTLCSQSRPPNSSPR